jgi:hypothetical protein
MKIYMLAIMGLAKPDTENISLKVSGCQAYDCSSDYTDVSLANFDSV